MQARLIGTITLIILAVLILVTLAAGPALAGDSCSVRQARREMVKARAEYREAVRVYEATKRYTRTYGKNVGRWVKLARRTSWPQSTWPHLFYVIDRESGGSPKAKNPASTASGLLQFLAFHWDGSGDYGWRFDPFDPRENLRYGYRLYRKCGWSPWAL